MSIPFKLLMTDCIAGVGFCILGALTQQNDIAQATAVIGLLSCAGIGGVGVLFWIWFGDH